ncbi:MAG: PAS domain S-box protein [Ignavibacteria bacterium]|nr:PAS domain S-box protein [Ignavibacteria bacterium]
MGHLCDSHRWDDILIPVCFVDSNGDIVFANKTFTDTFQTRTNIFHLFSDQYKQSIKNLFGSTNLPPQIITAELIGEPAKCVFKIQCNQYPGQSNKTLFQMLFLETIIAEKKMNRKTPNSKSKFELEALSSIVDEHPEATFLIDMKGRVLIWNKAMELLSGVPKENALGKDNRVYSVPFYGRATPMLIDLVQNPIDDELKKYTSLSNSNGVITGEVFLPLLANGVGAYCRCMAKMLYSVNGDPLGVMEVILNSSESDKQNQRNQINDERLRLMLQNSNDIFTIIRLDGYIAYMSPAIHKITGYDFTEFIEIPFIKNIHPKDTALVEDFLAKCFREPDLMHEITYRIACSDGSYRTLESYGKSHIADRAIGGIILNSRDVTEKTTQSETLRENQAWLLLQSESLKKSAEELREERTKAASAVFINEQYISRLKLLHQISISVSSKMRLEEVINQALDQLRSAFTVDQCILRLIEGEDLVLVGKSELFQEIIPEIIPTQNSLSSQILKAMAPRSFTLTPEDIHNESTEIQRKHRFVSFAGAPLLIKDTAVGVLGIYTVHSPREFSTEDLQHLQIAASHLATAIENNRLIRELEHKNKEFVKGVNEKLKTYQALLRSEENLRMLLEHQTDLIVKVQIDGRYLFVSKSFCKLFEKTETEFLKEQVPLLHRKELGLSAESMRYLEAYPYTWYVEQQVETATGKRWLGWNHNAILDLNGVIKEIVAAGRDITEKRFAEVALRSSEEKFSKAFITSPDAISIISLSNKKILEINQGFSRITGYSIGDVLGKDFTSLHIWVDSEQEQNFYAILRASGEVIDFESNFRLKSGVVIEGLLSAKLIQLQGETCVLSILRDVTRRNMNERAVEQYNKELTILNRIIMSSTAFTNNEELLKYFLLEVLQLAGLEHGLIYFRTIDSDFCTITSDNNTRAHANKFFSNCTICDKCPDSEHQFSNCPFIGADDDWHETIETTSEPDFKFQERFPIHITNTCLGVLILFSDSPLSDHTTDVINTLTSQIGIVVERTVLFEKVLKQADELDKKVKERTQQLESANKELEAFSYSVSHDLRAPLRAIDGFGLALYEDYYSNLDDQGRNYIQRIRVNSQKMAQLIDDILQMSRLTRKEIRRERISLSQLIREIAGDYQEITQTKEMIIDIEENMFDWVDPSLVRSCFQNLIDNAIKFSQYKEKIVIQIGTIVKDNAKYYFVKDEGAGFDMRYYNKLFGVFQRLHSNEQFPGTGVGLATVQRIIHKHGGTIYAEGKIGEGACFYFSFKGQN